MGIQYSTMETKIGAVLTAAAPGYETKTRDYASQRKLISFFFSFNQSFQKTF